MNTYLPFVNHHCGNANKICRPI